MISLIEFPQAFRQIYFNSPLIQIDLLQVRLREGNQSLIFLTKDLQNLWASGIKYVNDSSDALAVLRKHSATFQLKGVKPAFFQGRHGIRRNSDLTTDVRFSLRNRIDSVKLCDAASMLPSKDLDFRLAFGTIGGPKRHPPPRFKDAVVFEKLFESDFAFQSLRFRDPCDGYLRGVRLADRAPTPRFRE